MQLRNKPCWLGGLSLSNLENLDELNFFPIDNVSAIGRCVQIHALHTTSISMPLINKCTGRTLIISDQLDHSIQQILDHFLKLPPLSST